MPSAPAAFPHRHLRRTPRKQPTQEARRCPQQAPCGSDQDRRTTSLRSRFRKTRRVDLAPRVLRLVQPPAPPQRHRADDAGDRPPRPRRADPHRPPTRPRRRLRSPARAIRPPTAPAASATNRRLDQQTRQRGGCSLNSRPSCLIRLDRLRSPASTSNLRTPQAAAQRPSAAGRRSDLGAPPASVRDIRARMPWGRATGPARPRPRRRRGSTGTPATCRAGRSAS